MPRRRMLLLLFFSYSVSTLFSSTDSFFVCLTFFDWNCCRVTQFGLKTIRIIMFMPREFPFGLGHVSFECRHGCRLIICYAPLAVSTVGHFRRRSLTVSAVSASHKQQKLDWFFGLIPFECVKMVVLLLAAIRNMSTYTRHIVTNANATTCCMQWVCVWAVWLLLLGLLFSRTQELLFDTKYFESGHQNIGRNISIGTKIRKQKLGNEAHY